MLTQKIAATPNHSVRFLKLGLAGVAALSLLLFASSAYSDEVKVISTGSLTAASHELVPKFEQATRNKVVFVFGGSMGHSPTSVPGRVERGEPVDLVIVASSTFDELVKEGKIVPGSRVDLISSSIGMVVRAGAPKPDIRSVEALKRTLLKAGSVAFSDGASGVYLSTEMFQRLGVADQVMAKRRQIAGEPVGAVVARGDAEIGFEQISELLPVPGVDYVGPLPREVQKVTIFSAGVAVNAQHPKAARELIQFLASPAAASAIKKSGLAQVKPHGEK